MGNLELSNAAQNDAEAKKVAEVPKEVAKKAAAELQTQVEDTLNQPVATAEESEQTTENTEEEITLDTVKPLMAKGNSALNDEEASLLSKYYAQEAEKAQNKGETFMAIMMHLRALLASFKLDFLSAPEDATDKDGKPVDTKTEHPLAAPQKDEKLKPLEELANKVESVKNVPAMTLLAIAKLDGKGAIEAAGATEANLYTIADDVIAKLGKEKPAKDPVQCILAYIQAKIAPSTDSKQIAAEFAKYHVKVNEMYRTKEISYTGYFNWTTKAQTMALIKPAASIENAKPGTLFKMLSEKWKTKYANRLTPDKIASVNAIEKEVINAGYSLRMAAAMLANAWHESGWNKNAIGDSGNSVGLFQLHRKGVGHGMTVEERQDPNINTRAMIAAMERMKIYWNGKKTTFKELDLAGASIGDLANLFCYYVEAPKAKDTSRYARAKSAERMFEGNLV